MYSLPLEVHKSYITSDDFSQWTHITSLQVGKQIITRCPPHPSPPNPTMLPSIPSPALKAATYLASNTVDGHCQFLNLI